MLHANLYLEHLIRKSKASCKGYTRDRFFIRNPFIISLLHTRDFLIFRWKNFGEQFGSILSINFWRLLQEPTR